MDLKHPSAFDDAEVANLFRRVDKDKSGTMDFDEFVDLVYVELRDSIGLDHAVYGVPEYKLRRNPHKFKKPYDIFQLDCDPFRSLLAKQERGRQDRAIAHRTKRLAAMSQPLRRRDKAPPPKRRSAITSSSEAQLQLTRNIFDPEHHDLCSVPRKVEPPPEKEMPTFYFHPNYHYAGPPKIADQLWDGLSYPLNTTDLHKHAYSHSRKRETPFPRRSKANRDNVEAPSSLARPSTFVFHKPRPYRPPGSIHSGSTSASGT